jgi:4-amino-4-deoxy-L-arabinose transferase-like glycosyltransferase
VKRDLASVSSPRSSERERSTVSSRSRTQNPLAALAALFCAPYDSRVRKERAATIGLIAALVAITFLLRIFYSTHLYEDDGLWITAAEEALRGKVLYREIYLDKPPGIVLLYASLFRMFGPHLLVIRLVTIIYSIAVSVILYFFGAEIYDKRTGRIAALMFAFFSTAGATGHVQSLNTDFLAVLPYTASAWLFVRSAGAKSRRGLLAISSGLLAGLAFQINPKAAVNILFFIVFSAATVIARRAGPVSDEAAAPTGNRTPGTTLRFVGLALLGFLAGSLPFVVYLVVSGAWSDYRLFVWHWGSRYAAYFSLTSLFARGLPAMASYFALNNTLFITTAFAVFVTARRIAKRPLAAAGDRSDSTGSPHSKDRSTIVLFLWFALSLLGLSAGGRFYAHYFFQTLPALCLLGGWGSSRLVGALRSGSLGVRVAITGVLALGFAFTLVRFHGRTANLALDWIRGNQTSATESWRSEILKREERAAAAAVRDLEGIDPASLEIESIRQAGPRTRAPESPADYLFVWGYRPEIYYWSGLLPASRYLSTQQLTGVPADVHLINGENRSIIEDNLTARARAELLQDLSAIKPKYIIDELGFFNSALAMDDYPELAEFLMGYKNLGATGRFFIYRRRDMSNKRLKGVGRSTQ